MKLVHWKSRCYCEFVSCIHQTNVTYSSATQFCCVDCQLWHVWNIGCNYMMITWFYLFNFYSNQMAFWFEVFRNLSKRRLIGQLKLNNFQVKQIKHFQVQYFGCRNINTPDILYTLWCLRKRRTFIILFNLRNCRKNTPLMQNDRHETLKEKT